MSSNTRDHQLVAYLRRIAKSEDRGSLAALRSGLGKRPGEAPRMFPIMAEFLPEGRSTGAYVEALFLTASLFASHPADQPGQNLGASLRRAVRERHGEDGVSARLTAALDADPEDLPKHLPGLVSLCESAGTPIDWQQFLWDVYRLLADDEERRNQTRLDWARGFWARAKETHEPNEEIPS